MWMQTQKEPKLAICLNCGYAWYSQSIAVRPKCPVCGHLSGESVRTKKEEIFQ